jgi:hypothetical protein
LDRISYSSVLTMSLKRYQTPMQFKNKSMIVLILCLLNKRSPRVKATTEAALDREDFKTREAEWAMQEVEEGAIFLMGGEVVDDVVVILMVVEENVSFMTRVDKEVKEDKEDSFTLGTRTTTAVVAEVVEV